MTSFSQAACDLLPLWTVPTCQPKVKMPRAISWKPMARWRCWFSNRFPSMRSSFPEMHGLPISVRFLPDLTGHRGKLFSKTGVGQTIHAGTFIHKREIVLDSRLKRDPEELSRILVHEIFHFVWARLPNS